VNWHEHRQYWQHQPRLVSQAKLEVGSRGGIVIDNQCKTSDPDIYAIGECAVWNNQTFGLVAPGYNMGRTVVLSGLSGKSMPLR
jgi:nitrite reductase (NADH) large subunit